MEMLEENPRAQAVQGNQRSLPVETVHVGEADLDGEFVCRPVEEARDYRYCAVQLPLEKKFGPHGA